MKNYFYYITGCIFVGLAFLFGPVAEIVGDGKYDHATFNLILGIWCLYSVQD